MKVAVARIYHESNTFNPVPTTLDTLKAFGYREGDAMLDASFVSSELAGAVEAAGKHGIELAGLIKAGGWAGGKLAADDFDYLRSRFLARCRESLPVDGVYLALHGALVSEAEDDAEGNILEAVRELIGEKIPLVVTCDMHARTPSWSDSAVPATSLHTSETLVAIV